MRHKITQIVLLAITLISFSACGSSSSTDDNTTLNSCLKDKAWESCNLPEFKNNDTSPFNLLGHYGDNVYLGDKKIVGLWTLYDMDENGSKIEPDTYTHAQYEFFNDGTGRLSTLQTAGHEITYGVSTYGESFITTINHASELPRIYSIYGTKDDCFLVAKQYGNYFSNTSTHYFCKRK